MPDPTKSRNEAYWEAVQKDLKKQLKEILKLLGMKPRELMRTKETTYQDAGLDDRDLTDDQLLSAMIEYPVLIERPIVLAEGRAALGRPPEKVLEIL